MNTAPDLPPWAYWLLAPVMLVLLILYLVIKSDYPRYPRKNKKRDK